MIQKVIIFDFDGTIADTVDALVNIANRLAVEFNYAQITPEEFVILKNLTSREIFKYCGIPLFKIPFLLKKVKRELKNKIPELKPIQGIPEALVELKNDGNRLGVVTSNSKDNVQEFLKVNNLDNLFEFVHPGVTIFGKTKIINNILRQKQIKTQEVIYVGDETRDIEASRKSQIKVVSVTWGFNSEAALTKENPDFLIHHPRELVEIVKNFG
ncbi:MAG: HAD-IA family hydrolase [Rivularia sp. (in: cyanobacteria)]